MYLKLRQICLVASDKDQTVTDLADLLGMQPVHGSGDLSAYGLPARGPMSEGGRKLLAEQGVENLIFGAGPDFLEVLFPLGDDTTSARYLRRRGGDTGYMIILQGDDLPHFAALAGAEGVRIVHQARFPTYADIHLHTKDTGGALLSVARHLPENEPGGAWYPAGTAWETMEPGPIVEGIIAVEIQSEEPKRLAERWGRLLGISAKVQNESFVLRLDDGELRFVAAVDGRGEGFSGFDLKIKDRERVEAAAAARHVPLNGDVLSLCGMRCRLVN
ncbi:MAG: hypothetical protein EPO08_07955 [Rhodospirillaceae bacterium]|nr:MAG: hypothetical protein EPO08_07955 [Rhodospirillaceae bacterium]